MWLRGNLRSGAVTRGGASAPTLYHEAIMLGEWFYLPCIISCDIKDAYYIVRYKRCECKVWGRFVLIEILFFSIYCISNMYRDIKILSECVLLLMCEYLLIVNVNECKKYCVLLCCFI